MSRNKDILEEFEDLLLNFDMDWESMDLELDFKKMKKQNDLYCNCSKPDVVKRGFSRTVYNFCRTCRKEKLDE